MNKLQQQESENEVQLFKIEGDINEETKRADLLQIQKSNSDLQNQIDGSGEAEKVGSFLAALEKIGGGPSLNPTVLLIFSRVWWGAVFFHSFSVRPVGEFSDCVCHSLRVSLQVRTFPRSGSPYLIGQSNFYHFVSRCEFFRTTMFFSNAPTKVKSFLQALEKNVPQLADRIKMWQTLRKQDALGVLAGENTKLYYTPEGCNLSIETFEGGGAKAGRV